MRQLKTLKDLVMVPIFGPTVYFLEVYQKEARKAIIMTIKDSNKKKALKYQHKRRWLKCLSGVNTKRKFTRP